MSQNRIEQLIEEMYEYIEGCKPKNFSATQVIVTKEEIYDILDEMRLKVPEEIRRCAKVVANKEQILANATEQAERIIADAKYKAEQLVQESEIRSQAYMQANAMTSRAAAQANQMIQEATEAAEAINSNALSYTDELLAVVERTFEHTYAETKARTEELLRVLEENIQIVKENRSELIVVPPEETAPAEDRSAYRSAADDLYDLDSDAFLNNID